MVERPGPLALSRQCQLLGLNRAALYYQAAQVDAYELELMVRALILDGDRIEAPPAVVLACGVFGTPRLLKASAIQLQRGCSDGPTALSLADATEEAVLAVLAYLHA